MRMLVWGSLAASVLVASSAAAHHSFGTFLMNENIELKGTVTKLDYVNPHSWLHLAATGPDGKISEYKCEMRSATTLRRSGWTLEMFAPGTGVTVQGAPDRVDPHACYVSSLVLADGTQLDRYGQRVAAKAPVERAARLPSGEPNLAGDWAQEQLVMTDSKGLNGTLVPLSQGWQVRTGRRARRAARDPGRTRHRGSQRRWAAVESARAAQRGRTHGRRQGRDGQARRTTARRALVHAGHASSPIGAASRSTASRRAPIPSRFSTAGWGSSARST